MSDTLTASLEVPTDAPSPSSVPEEATPAGTSPDEGELRRIARELDEAHIPQEVFIGTDSAADRVTWLIRHSAAVERTAKNRFEMFAVEFGLLRTLDDEWRTADELHGRIGYGEREDVKRALEYLWGRGLIAACNNGHRGNLYAAKAEGGRS